MKKLLSLALLAATLSAPAADAATGSFEGKLGLMMSGPGSMPGAVTMSLKGNRSRMDVNMQGRSMAMLFDQSKNEVTMLMPEQKMYMVQPIPNAAEKAGGDEEGTLEKTDLKEKILGYECTKYIAKSRGTTTDLWLTDQLGTFMGFGSGGAMGPDRGRGRRGDSWEKLLKGKEIFPLRVVSHGPDGKETFRLDVTSVEKTSLPDSVFAPPADYQKFDMGTMRGGAGGMRPPSGG
jgi:hypothetical protein